MTKDQIIAAADHIFTALAAKCRNVEEGLFFEREPGKWSVAENLQHLIISTNTSTLAYSLPKFLVKWIGGRDNPHGATYEELAARYFAKLDEGAKASGRYVPEPVEVKYGKDRLLKNWEKATLKFISALEHNRTEADLDEYFVKHPLLGRISLRELGYFTIFHTEHHLRTIEKRLSPES